MNKKPMPAKKIEDLGNKFPIMRNRERKNYPIWMNLFCKINQYSQLTIFSIIIEQLKYPK